MQTPDNDEANHESRSRGMSRGVECLVRSTTGTAVGVPRPPDRGSRDRAVGSAGGTPRLTAQGEGARASRVDAGEAVGTDRRARAGPQSSQATADRRRRVEMDRARSRRPPRCRTRRARRSSRRAEGVTGPSADGGRSSGRAGRLRRPSAPRRSPDARSAGPRPEARRAPRQGEDRDPDHVHRARTDPGRENPGRCGRTND